MQVSVATRKAFGKGLMALADKYPNLVVLDADLSKSTMSNEFSKNYPQRFLQMGIAEANMLGVASGLALSGYIPFACSFACFITGRFDQIRMSIAYSNAAVRIIGTHAGIGIGEDGYSQQGLEDISLMQALPTMQVLQPADDHETLSMMEYLCKSNNPAYLRLTRQDLLRVHKEDYSFRLGVFPQLRNYGNDTIIFATGGCVQHALEACDELNKQGIKAQVYNASSIKPVDEKALYQAATSAKILFSIEDHNIIGGLGSALAQKLCQMGTSSKLIPLGIQDTFGESGTPQDLYKKYKLDSPGIMSCIKKCLS